MVEARIYEDIYKRDDIKDGGTQSQIDEYILNGS